MHVAISKLIKEFLTMWTNIEPIIWGDFTSGRERVPRYILSIVENSKKLGCILTYLPSIFLASGTLQLLIKSTHKLHSAFLRLRKVFQYALKCALYFKRYKSMKWSFVHQIRKACTAVQWTLCRAISHVGLYIRPEASICTWAWLKFFVIV